MREPVPCPYRPRTGMFNGSGGDNKSEGEKIMFNGSDNVDVLSADGGERM